MKSCGHPRKPRYLVGMPPDRVLYQGDSRLLAWVAYMVYRRAGAIAYDRRTWMIDPTSWLRWTPPENEGFSAGAAKMEPPHSE